MVCRTIRILAVLACTSTIACDAGRETDRGAEEVTASASRTAHAISGTAGLPDEMQTWVEGQLDDLAEESAALERLLSGDLYALTEDSSRKRFVLIGLGTPYGDDDEVVLILLDDMLAEGRSEPLLTGVLYDEYNFEPLARIDADEDGLLDFAYCGWPTAGSEGEVSIVGYQSSWYEIDAGNELACGPQGSPQLQPRADARNSTVPRREGAEG